MHRVALGDKDECIDINVTETTQFSSLRTPRHGGVEEFTALGNRVAGREQVRVCRLDTIAAEVISGLSSRRLYLKMDTQGWDLQVLAGLGEVETAVVGVQSELSVVPIYDGMPDYRVALDVLNDLGFEIAGMFPVSRDQCQRLVEFDCVALRASIGRPGTRH